MIYVSLYRIVFPIFGKIYPRLRTSGAEERKVTFSRLLIEIMTKTSLFPSMNIIPLP